MKLHKLITTHSSACHFSFPYIIAEAGVNHECSLDIAFRLIDEAKEGGADAIKFQAYKAHTLASKNSPSYWDLNKEPTTSQYKLFSKYDKFWKSEFEILATRCNSVGIEFLSTPFDLESARFLNDMMTVFKISSSDITNKPFVEFIASLGKPIILSTGASYQWEVEQCVSWISSNGNALAILHCILNYPTLDCNANLLMIRGLCQKFPDCAIGYSDHTLPGDMNILEIASLLGAKIIEKHFTHDKKLPGNDHYHAMDKYDLIRFTKRIKDLELILGMSHRVPLPSEHDSRINARRSLVSARHIPLGKLISVDDLTFKRPCTGIDPRNYDSLIGQYAVKEIPEDTVLHWDMFRQAPN